MSVLFTPSMTMASAFAEAMDDWATVEDVTPVLFSELFVREPTRWWHNPYEVGPYVRQLRSEKPARAAWVPATTRWAFDDGHMVGRIMIRHHLTDDLRELGGHIGYDVRPSFRREGFATEMLIAALPIARDRGITEVLLTVARANEASRRVIEHCGGQLTDVRNGQCYYLITI